MIEDEVRGLLRTAEVRLVRPVDLLSARARGRSRVRRRRLTVAAGLLVAAGAVTVPAHAWVEADRHPSTLAGPPPEAPRPSSGSPGQTHPPQGLPAALAAQRFVADTKACLAGLGYDTNGQPNGATGAPPPSVAFALAQTTCAALFGSPQAPRNDLPRTITVTNSTPGEYSEVMQACLAGQGVTVIVTGPSSYSATSSTPAVAAATAACTLRFGNGQASSATAPSPR